jgi:hypothetical protein
VRRDILRELDKPGGVNIGLIDAMCRHTLDAGHSVVLEGILSRSRYGEMLQKLTHDHMGTTSCFYLDVSLEETVRRHATRPQSANFSADMMRQWYQDRDLLPDGCEIVLGEDSSLEETVQRILCDSNLMANPGGALLSGEHTNLIEIRSQTDPLWAAESRPGSSLTVATDPVHLKTCWQES